MCDTIEHMLYEDHIMSDIDKSYARLVFEQQCVQDIEFNLLFIQNIRIFLDYFKCQIKYLRNIFWQKYSIKQYAVTDREIILDMKYEKMFEHIIALQINILFKKEIVLGDQPLG